MSEVTHSNKNHWPSSNDGKIGSQSLHKCLAGATKEPNKLVFLWASSLWECFGYVMASSFDEAGDQSGLFTSPNCTWYLSRCDPDIPPSWQWCPRIWVEEESPSDQPRGKWHCEYYSVLRSSWQELDEYEDFKLNVLLMLLSLRRRKMNFGLWFLSWS